MTVIEYLKTKSEDEIAMAIGESFNMMATTGLPSDDWRIGFSPDLIEEPFCDELHSDEGCELLERNSDGTVSTECGLWDRDCPWRDKKAIDLYVENVKHWLNKEIG